MDAYAAPAKAATLLTGLGFKEAQLNEPFWLASRVTAWVMLAAVLFIEPDFLLLDEPTNHLDLEAIMSAGKLSDVISAYDDDYLA